MIKKINKKIIIANWKMNPISIKEAEKLFTNVSKSISHIKNTDIVICSPFIYLPSFAKALAGKGKIKKLISLGAQNAFWGDTGAFTGEVSTEMLYNIGVKYVILGHSERRALGENNGDINKKIKAALNSSLRPILCVGESIRDLDHSYFNLVKTQLEECLIGISKNSISKIIIAYEPVWAISSTPNRKNATPADSLEMIIFIRKILSDKFGRDVAQMRIIYGGSVSDRDAQDFLENGGVDGLLPGKASLDAKKFVEIINIAENNYEIKNITKRKS